MNIVVPKTKMRVAEFLSWAEKQPSGRYELVDGSIVAMSPERAKHNLVKAAVYRGLFNAVSNAGLPCTVFIDGMTVVIDEHHSREPDVAIQCGRKVDPESTILDSPIIVVEVISPSSERGDTSTKLLEYLSVPSIRHYLIIDPTRLAVIHHARGEAGEIRTTIQRDGEVSLIPPGFSVAVRQLLDDEPPQ